MALYSDEHFQLLKSFTAHEVRFLIIGGHAAIYYGVNRNTGDLDIFVEPTRENGIKVIQALAELKLEIPEIDPAEFEQNLVLTFGLTPDAVDIINYTVGIEFTEAHNNALLVDFSEVQIKMIDIRDLLKNKQALNRPGEKSLLDKYDVEILKKIITSKKQP